MGLLNKSEKIFKVCSYLLVIVFALVTLYPIVYAFSVSISGKLAYESGLITLLPKDITLQAYEMVIESKGFWIAYANTLFYTVIGTAWSMGISLTGAYALQKKKLKFRRQWNFLLVFTMWFSAGMIPLYLNYKSMHVDNRWGMVVAFGVQAYNIILLRNYFSSIPKELEEAAIVDGASYWQKLFHITLPLVKPSLTVATVLNIIYVFNSFPIVWTITKGDPASRTDTLVTYLYKLAFYNGKQGEAAAVSVIGFLILLVCASCYMVSTLKKGED